MNVYVYVCDLRTLNVILINQINIDVIYFVLWNSANLKFEQLLGEKSFKTAVSECHKFRICPFFVPSAENVI